MPNFCENCGEKLNPGQDVCLKCGKMIKKVKEEVKAEEEGDFSKASNGFSIYFIVSGIVMIILSLLLFLSLGYYADSLLEDYVPFLFGLPAVAAMIGGIISIIMRKNKTGIISAAFFYLAGALINTIGVCMIEERFDISIFSIASVVFFSLHLYFSGKIEN